MKHLLLLLCFVAPLAFGQDVTCDLTTTTVINYTESDNIEKLFENSSKYTAMHKASVEDMMKRGQKIAAAVDRNMRQSGGYDITLTSESSCSDGSKPVGSFGVIMGDGVTFKGMSKILKAMSDEGVKLWELTDTHAQSGKKRLPGVGQTLVMSERRRNRMSLGNCLFYALKRYKTGGYLVMRRSRHGWWPHFLWTSSLRGIEIEQLVPARPIDWNELPWWKRILPLHTFLYRGVLRRDDD